jgi:hypothetical protein
MRYVLLFFLCVIEQHAFSQKESSYYFDNMVVECFKNYENGFDGKIILLNNLKDSTYNLAIRLSDKVTDATITDRHKKQIIKFDAYRDFKGLEDIHKLFNSQLYKVVIFDHPKQYRHYVEDFEYERDSANNKITVHLTQYKNKKRRKIINEHYYFFGTAPDCKSYSNNSMKNYIYRKYKIDFSQDCNLQKILHLTNGKINAETQIAEIKKIDFTYTFPIDNVFPKNNYN